MELTVEEAIHIGKEILKEWPFPPLPEDCWKCPTWSELGLFRKNDGKS